jgi:DNA-binding MarR family transcriptional regulator
VNVREQTARVLERLSRVLLNDSASGGLNPTQWEALRFFALANRFSSTPSGLTAFLGVTKGTVSQTVRLQANATDVAFC